MVRRRTTKTSCCKVRLLGPRLQRFALLAGPLTIDKISISGQGVDTDLSETGIRQGEAVGKYLRDIRFNNVFVSNLRRAMQVTETSFPDLLVMESEDGR